MVRITEEAFDRAVEEAMSRVPEQFHPYLENIVIEVIDQPNAQMLADFLPDEDVPPDELLGLYAGTPLEFEESPTLDVPLPGRIYIFRRNLCAMCETVEELVEEIRITVLHEIGHHFGLDEDQLRELGYD